MRNRDRELNKLHQAKHVKDQKDKGETRLSVWISAEDSEALRKIEKSLGSSNNVNPEGGKWSQRKTVSWIIQTVYKGMQKKTATHAPYTLASNTSSED